MQLQQTVQESQLQARWDAFFQGEEQKNRVVQAALDYPETRSVLIPFTTVQEIDADLANYILDRPTHALRVGEAAMHQVDAPVEPRPRLRLRVTALPETDRLTIANLRIEHLGRFVGVEGVVRKVTEPRDEIHEACFECKFCANQEFILQEQDLLMEPLACSACEKSGPWKLRLDDSKYMDDQRLQLEESPEGMRGSRAGRIEVMVQQDLVGLVLPGDRIRINSIVSNRLQRTGQMKRTTLEKVLVANSIETLERDYDDLVISDEDLKQIRKWARRKNPHQFIAERLAPSVYGMNNEKLALVMAAFGGVACDHGDSYQRGDIHVLMVGDPGVAKSQLLKAMRKLVPRAVMASGKTSSTAGLTAAAVKDEFGGGSQWTLEAGILVQADNGVALIDELDKMSEHDQSAMHDAMEQQEISIAKAGVAATLKSRCAVIGAANPKLGRFDASAPLGEQINLPPALASRFDLLLVVTDNNTKDDDAKAEHMLRRRQRGAVAKKGEVVSKEREQELDLLRKWVAHAKGIRPALSDEALEVLKKAYTDLRKEAARQGRPGISARVLEATSRIAEATARIRLDDQVLVADAEFALGIVQYALRSCGAIDEHGNFDVDVLTAGLSSSQADRIRLVQDVVRRLSKKSDKGFAFVEDVHREALQAGLTLEETEKALKTLLRDNSIYARGGAGTFAPL